jgi:hypothetical protein
MKTLSLILLCLFSKTVLAADDQTGAWLGTFANKKLTSSFNYWLETQVRFNHDQDATKQVLYRTGLLHKIGKSHSLGYLYAFIQSGLTREHRFTFQHGQTYGILANFKFSHRARLEARILEDDDTKNAGRARYLLRVEQNKDHYGLVIWNEYFANLNKTTWNGDTHSDRNRFFIGIKNKFLASNRIEFGYLNQYVPRDTGDVSEHILTFYFFF